jgi:hypothetical protein
VDVSEAAQDPAGHPDAEGVDQLLPEQALGDGVEDEGPLTREVDEPAGGVEFEEFLQVQFFDAQTTPQGDEPSV